MPIPSLGIQSKSGKQFFSANGTFTPTFTGTVYVTMISGGMGGSSGTAAGDGGRVIVAQQIAVTQGSPVTVTIGTGGATPQVAGTDTSFGAATTVTGAAQAAATLTPGRGGNLTPYGDGGLALTPGRAGCCLVEF